MFANKHVSTNIAQDLDQRVKRHFSGRKYRYIDWSGEALLVVLFAFVLGGAAKAVGFPIMAAMATLLVGVTYLGLDDEPSPNAWLARLSLFITAAFYGALGYCFGWVALLLLPGFFVCRGLAQLKS